MPTAGNLQQPISGCEPLTKTLDEAAWEAWLASNRAQNLRTSANWVKSAKWVSVVTLVAAIVFGSQLGSHGVIVRFVLALGAIVVMLDAVHFRHYTFATVFGTLALLYNPVLPVMDFSDFWQFVFMILSAVLFIISLTWRRVKLPRYDYRCDFGVHPTPKRLLANAVNVSAGEEGLPLADG